MKHAYFLLRATFLGTLAVMLAGCASSPPVRFYTLTPVGNQEAQRSSPEGASHVAVRVMPVEIPDYLDRPQIMTRDGRNALKLAEFDRWAGSLSDNIAAVLAENLGLSLGSDRIFVAPGLGGEKADYSVTMQVIRLDSHPGDQVLLKARWTVFAGQGRADAATQVATFSHRLNDSRYETIVSGISQTLEQLSREIALEIIHLSQGATSNKDPRPHP